MSEVKELPTVLEPYTWLQVKGQYKVKINGIIPAGSDFNHPYNRYELLFEGGEKLVMKEGLLRELFGFTGIIGLYAEDFDTAVTRIEAEKPKEDDEKALLVSEAKELGIKQPHLMKIETLKEKIAEAKKEA